MSRCSPDPGARRCGRARASGEGRGSLPSPLPPNSKLPLSRCAADPSRVSGAVPALCTPSPLHPDSAPAPSRAWPRPGTSVSHSQDGLQPRAQVHLHRVRSRAGGADRLQGLPRLWGPCQPQHTAPEGGQVAEDRNRRPRPSRHFLCPPALQWEPEL